MTTVRDTFGNRVPKPFNPKGEVACVNPNQIIGYELEIEKVNTWDGWNEYQHNGLSEAMARLGFTIQGDGSLRGVAAEFITNPMMMRNALYSLTEFFKATGYGEENYTDRCSVHVHANCTDMTLEQVAGLCMLYSVVEEPLFEFIGNYRDTNIYCVPWYQCRDHANVVYNCLSNPIRMRNWQKYTALNLLPLTTLGTVEFRHMHGTADVGKLTKWTNIIGALMAEAKKTTLDDVEKEILELNTTSHYKMFFERMTGGQLEYNPVMAEKLESGIIQAKYSLMDRKAPRKLQVEEQLGDRHVGEFDPGPEDMIENRPIRQVVNVPRQRLQEAAAQFGQFQARGADRPAGQPAPGVADAWAAIRDGVMPAEEGRVFWNEAPPLIPRPPRGRNHPVTGVRQIMDARGRWINAL